MIARRRDVADGLFRLPAGPKVLRGLFLRFAQGGDCAVGEVEASIRYESNQVSVERELILVAGNLRQGNELYVPGGPLFMIDFERD